MPGPMHRSFRQGGAARLLGAFQAVALVLRRLGPLPQPAQAVRELLQPGARSCPGQPTPLAVTQHRVLRARPRATSSMVKPEMYHQPRDFSTRRTMCIGMCP